MIFGNIDQDDLTCDAYAEAVGCVVVNVEYRLAPEHPYPAPVEDCYAALRWMADHGDVAVRARRGAVLAHDPLVGGDVGHRLGEERRGGRPHRRERVAAQVLGLEAERLVDHHAVAELRIDPVLNDTSFPSSPCGRRDAIAISVGLGGPTGERHGDDREHVDLRAHGRVSRVPALARPGRLLRQGVHAR